jgi:hypothetical protein
VAADLPRSTRLAIAPAAVGMVADDDSRRWRKPDRDVVAVALDGCCRQCASTEILAHFGAFGLLRRAIGAAAAIARCAVIQRPSMPRATACASLARRSRSQRRYRAAREQTA